MAYRQEVLNVILAQVLQDRGVIAAPENILKQGQKHQRHMPDVLVNYQGLRLAIEGEVSDAQNAREKAQESARRRVEQGIAHIGVGVVYPEFLRTVNFTHLKNELAACDFQIAVITESTSTNLITGSIGTLESALKNAFEQLIREDVVAQAVAALDGGIERFASVMVGQGGAINRLADILGIRDLSEGKKQSDESEDDEA